jgi:tetratricopeptide (TPR) repeat protein
MGKTGLRRTEKTSAAGVEYTEHARWSGGSTSGGSPSEERASEAESGGSVENGAEDGAKSSAPADMGGVEKRLHIGFFRRLFTPEHEMALVEGLKEFVAGGEEDAVERLAGAPNLADARYIAGFLSIKLDRLQEAAEHLQAAAASGDRLGSYLNKYGLSLTFFLPVTEHVRACITPSVRGALLALTECQQELGCLTEATDTARELVDTDREDPAALLSLVELRSRAEGRDELEEVIRLTTGVENVSELHAALLYYKGKTLHRLGMPAAARDALSAALRRKKNRSEELLRAACYERALVYEELGNTAREKEELEKIYAEAPDYMDVAERLSA